MSGHQHWYGTPFEGIPGLLACSCGDARPTDEVLEIARTRIDLLEGTLHNLVAATAIRYWRSGEDTLVCAESDVRELLRATERARTVLGIPGACPECGGPALVAGSVRGTVHKPECPLLRAQQHPFVGDPGGRCTEEGCGMLFWDHDTVKVRLT